MVILKTRYIHSMNSKTEHTGVIDSIEGRKVVVRVTQQSACASCQMAGHCHSVESRNRLIDVQTSASHNLKEGDRVRVVISSASGFKALGWAMVLPMALLVAAVIAVRLAGGSDLAAALCGLGVLVPYYLALRIMRNKIERTISVAMERIKE